MNGSRGRGTDWYAAVGRPRSSKISGPTEVLTLSKDAQLMSPASGPEDPSTAKSEVSHWDGKQEGTVLVL